MESEKNPPVPAKAYVFVYPNAIYGSLEKQWEMTKKVNAAKESFSKEPQEFLPEGYLRSASFGDPYLNSKKRLENWPNIIRFSRIIGPAEENICPDFQKIPLKIDSGIYYGNDESGADWSWTIIYPESCLENSSPEKYSEFCLEAAKSVLISTIDPFYNSSLGIEARPVWAFIGDFFPSVSMAKRYHAKYHQPTIQSDRNGLNISDLLSGEPLSAEEAIFIDRATAMDEDELRENLKARRHLKKRKIPMISLPNDKNPTYNETYALISKVKPPDKRILQIQGLVYDPDWAHGAADSYQISETVRSGIDSFFENYRVAGIDRLLSDFKISGNKPQK